MKCNKHGFHNEKFFTLMSTGSMKKRRYINLLLPPQGVFVRILMRPFATALARAISVVDVTLYL